MHFDPSQTQQPFVPPSQQQQQLQKPQPPPQQQQQQQQQQNTPPQRQTIQLHRSLEEPQLQQQKQQQKQPQEEGIPEHLRTTVMLRNIPNDYNFQMLKELLDSFGFFGQYDFLYLPVDFRKGANIGYAFVNGVEPAAARRIRDTLEGFDRWVLPSQKVCEVSWSHPQQGLWEHIERYRNSPVMHESTPPEYKP